VLLAVLLTTVVLLSRGARHLPLTLTGPVASRTARAHQLMDMTPLVANLVEQVNDAFADIRNAAINQQTVRHMRGDTRPLRAIATFADADYCHAVWVLFKSVRRLDPAPGRYAFIVLTRDIVEQMMAKPFCAALAKHGALFARVPPIPLPEFTKIAFPHWLISMQKISVFMLPDVYERVVFLDGDVVLTRDIDKFFDFPDDLHFAAVTDQWDGCHRREVYNGGVWSLKPSVFLFSAMISRLQYQSCLSKTWWWSDQELINCICGGAGAVADRSDIKCQLLNYEWGAQQKALPCPEYISANVKAVHFIVSKPWGLKRDMDEMVRYCWCLDDGGSLDIARVTTNTSTCPFP